MRVVIDHVSGARRGQRQELPADARVRFGRHPECEVAFDTHRDLDASSRHAELRPVPGGWVLVDIGSSNGTYVDGRRVTEAPIAPGAQVHVEFAQGGPRVRLFVGDAGSIAALPKAVVDPARPWWLVPVVAGGALVVAAVVLAATC